MEKTTTTKTGFSCVTRFRTIISLGRSKNAARIRRRRRRWKKTQTRAFSRSDDGGGGGADFRVKNVKRERQCEAGDDDAAEPVFAISKTKTDITL